MGIRQKIHDIQRVRRILQVTIKYGFGYIVDRLHIEHSIIGRRIIAPGTAAIAGESPPVRLRRMLEELGPTFIKLGQILSMRPDILPPEYTQELEKLQDRVAPFPRETAERIIAAELKGVPGEHFRSIASEPKASASLAQVYEAQLVSGESVVVKVQRPGLDATIASDVEILYELAHLANRYLPETRVFNLVSLVDEFKATIFREIDFVNEAYTVDRFRNQFKDDPTVHIPKVFHRYSTRRVLTLENVSGIKITDIAAIEAAGLDRRRIAKNGADALLKQIFFHGYFHADPHPGNLLVRRDNQVVFLDFGMVGRISEQMKARLSDILVGVINRDIRAIRDAFLTIGSAGENVDTAQLDLELEDFVFRFYDRPLSEINIGQLLMDMIRLVSRHHIRLPPDLFLLSKVLVTIDGIGRILDPEFNMVEEAKPFVRDLEQRKYSPRAVARDVRSFVRTLARFARALPRDLSEIFAKLKQGTLKVEFEHRGLEGLVAQIDKASSRIAFSLIIAALLVGSSILMHADIGPRYFGYPLLGMLIFIVAAVMGLWLAIVILSSGRL